MKKLTITMLILLLMSFPVNAHWPTNADQSKTNTSNFDGNCGSDDDTVQKCLDKLDDVAGVGDTTETNQDAAWQFAEPSPSANRSGTQSGIDVNYQDATNDVDFEVDVDPDAGSATLIIEEDAVQIKYDSTDFQESTNGLYLGDSPTIATSLAVGNITINTNDISSTAGTDLTITPLGGQQIVLDGTIVIDAGEVTGATSITSTAFVGDLTGDVTGNVTGNVSGTAATVTGAAQANITSLGTLTTVTIDDITINANTISSAGASTLAITPNVGQAITLDGAVTIDAGVVAGITSLTLTGADASPSSNGMIVYDNVAAGVDDGQLAYYGGGDTVYYLPSYVTLPTDSEDDYHLAYDKDTDRLYWRADADSGSPLYNNIGDPDAAGSISFDAGETATYTSAGTAADQYNFIMTGNMGDISAVKIDQNTGTPTDGTMLEIATDNASVDHMLIQYGASDYAIIKIVDAGTFSIDVTSDGTAAVDIVDGLTAGSLTSDSGLSIADAGNIGSASDADSIAIDATGNVTFSQNVIVSGTGIELNHVTDNTLTASGGVLSIEGNVIHHTNGTDITDADIADDLTITSTKKLATTLTSEQLRLSYDASNYATWTVGANGDLTVATVDDGVGTAGNLTFSPDGTIILTPATDIVGALTAASVTSDAGMAIADGGNIGSASDADSIAIDATGNVTFSQNVVVSGTGIELNHATANTLTASGGVLSIEGSALATLTSPIFLTSMEIPNGTSGTTDATGEIYLDTDGDGAEFDGPVLQISTNDATVGYAFTTAALPGTAEDNYVIKYNAATDLISWEADDTGSALGGSLASTTNDITTDNTIIQLEDSSTSENLTITFSANAVAITSDSAVGSVDFGTIDLGTDALDLSEGNIANVGQIDADTIIADGSALAIGDGTETIAIDSTNWNISAAGAADFTDLKIVKAGAIFQLDGTDNWEIRIDETGNSLEIGSSLGGVGDNVEVEITTAGNLTATGAVEGATVTDGTITLAGDGTVTGLAQGGLNDSTITGADILDDTVDSADYAADSIDNEHINWADIDNLDNEGMPIDFALTSDAGVADGIAIQFGAGPDWDVAFDAVGDARIEFIYLNPATANTGDVYWDLVDTAGNSTFIIENSNVTYVTNMTIDGSITQGGNAVLDAATSWSGGDLGATGIAPTVTDLTITNETHGDILFRNATNWVRLEAGTNGHVLTTHTAGSDPTWEAVTASAGGSAGSVQYHDGAGGITGEAAFVYAAGSNELTVGSVTASGTITDGTASLTGGSWTGLSTLTALTGMTLASQTNNNISITPHGTGDIVMTVDASVGLTLDGDASNHSLLSVLNEASGDEAAFSISYTNTKAAGNDYGMIINMTTDTGGGTSYLMDLRNEGVTKFRVDEDGTLTQAARTTAGIGIDDSDDTSWNIHISDAGLFELRSGSATIGGGNLEATLSVNSVLDLTASGNYAIGGVNIIDDNAGATELQNIDSIDATTETTLESEIDALANLTTVGTVTTGVWNAGAVTSSGAIQGLVQVTLDTAATVDLSASTDADGEWRVNNDDDVIQYTLPPGAAGLTVCFYDHSTNGQIISIDPDDGTDAIYLEGASIGAGDELDSPGDRGDFVCLMALDGDTWVTLGMKGTWVDGGAS